MLKPPVVIKRPIPNRRIVLYSTVALLIAPMAFPGTDACGQAGDQESLDQNTVRFVGDVICRNEFLGTGERQCNRWIESPTLSTFGSASHHPNVISNVVRQLNECLPDNQQIRILDPDNDLATLKVYFLALSEFPEVAKQHNIDLVAGNWGFFDLRWNVRFEIEQANVLIAHDKLSGRRLHHFVLEEITQSLGLAGDSTRFEKSVFYEDQSQKKYGTVTRLSDVDKKTIRFLYQHLKPGQHPIEVGIAMAKYWSSM